MAYTYFTEGVVPSPVYIRYGDWDVKINKELFLAILLVASMVVGCGGGGGAGAGSAPANVPPVANAGTVQNVTVGTAVILDGSASSDANNDPLTYSWTLTSVPASSTATLSGASSVAPTFTADKAGTYVATLTVSDGNVSSASSTVDINAAVGNVAPVANAGPDQNVVAGALVTLDGSTSSDANNDPLSYMWSLTSKPASSNAVLSSTTTAKPTFTADKAGTYVASLTVSDGTVNSTNATVNINAAVGNAAPVANAGTDQNAATGTLVTLDGSASSDANNDPLTYMWNLTSKPASSNAMLSSPTAVKPTFTADRAGTYVATLTVFDGTVISASTPVSITAIPPSITLTPSAAPSFNPANLTYLRSITVAVTDGLGNPIPGVTVNLSLRPVDYYKGQRDAACNAVAYGPFFDEDTNANSLLDPGEDVDGPGGYTLGGMSATLGTPDGALWTPPATLAAMAAAGYIPASVTTAAVGVSGVGTASVDWVYLPAYADWGSARIQANAVIQGELYSASANLPLLSLPSIPCTLPDSPFN